MASARGDVLALIIVIIILAMVAFGWQTYARRGNTPSLTHEVFLHFDPDNAAPDATAANSIAASLRSAVATPGQVAIYAADGGKAAAPGLTSSGDVYWVPGVLYAGPSAIEKLGSGTSFPFGVWIFGPKPAKGTSLIAPFGGTSWYQQSAGAAEPVVGMTASRLATAQRRFAHRTQLSRRHI
jgi:hypothetical protein